MKLVIFELAAIELIAFEMIDFETGQAYMYKPDAWDLAFDDWIDYVEKEKLPFVTAADKDATLADFRDEICHFEGRGASTGGQLVSGVQAVLPLLPGGGSLPESPLDYADDDATRAAIRSRKIATLD